MYWPPKRANLYHVKTDAIVGKTRMVLKENFGGADNTLLLPERKGFPDMCRVAAGFDFNKNNKVSLFSDNINFPGMVFMPSGNNMVSFYLQKQGR